MYPRVQGAVCGGAVPMSITCRALPGKACSNALEPSPTMGLTPPPRLWQLRYLICGAIGTAQHPVSLTLVLNPVAFVLVTVPEGIAQYPQPEPGGYGDSDWLLRLGSACTTRAKAKIGPEQMACELLPCQGWLGRASDRRGHVCPPPWQDPLSRACWALCRTSSTCATRNRK